MQRAISAGVQINPSGNPADHDSLDRAAAGIAKAFDPVHGGVCSRCNRLLCSKHIFGSIGRRLQSFLGRVNYTQVYLNDFSVTRLNRAIEALRNLEVEVERFYRAAAMTDGTCRIRASLTATWARRRASSSVRGSSASVTN